MMSVSGKSAEFANRLRNPIFPSERLGFMMKSLKSQFAVYRRVTPLGGFAAKPVNEPECYQEPAMT